MCSQVVDCSRQPMLLTKVADECREACRRSEIAAGHRKLDGKDFPARPDGSEFQPAVKQGSGTGGDMSEQASAMAFPHRWRNDHVGDLPPNCLIECPTEYSLSCGIELADASVFIHDDDRVERRFDDRSIPGLAHRMSCFHFGRYVRHRAAQRLAQVTEQIPTYTLLSMKVPPLPGFAALKREMIIASMQSVTQSRL